MLDHPHEAPVSCRIPAVFALSLLQVQPSYSLNAWVSLEEAFRHLQTIHHIAWVADEEVAENPHVEVKVKVIKVHLLICGVSPQACETPCMHDEHCNHFTATDYTIGFCEHYIAQWHSVFAVPCLHFPLPQVRMSIRKRKRPVIVVN